MLARAGLEREALYLTYADKDYKWETLDQQRVHRTPVWRELEACQYWLEKELAQVRATRGRHAGRDGVANVTGPHVNLSEYLGQTIAHDGRLIVPTWHPSYALGMTDATLRDDVVATIAAVQPRGGAGGQRSLGGEGSRGMTVLSTRQAKATGKRGEDQQEGRARSACMSMQERRLTERWGRVGGGGREGRGGKRGWEGMGEGRGRVEGGGERKEGGEE